MGRFGFPGLGFNGSMATIYLALGSNLGDREKNILEAVAILKANNIRVEKLSTIIETEPVGGSPQGKFLNAVLKAATELAPRDLLMLTQSIENKLGRVRSVLNAARTIDIDILLYDRQKVDTPQLTIPHPRMFQRDFVLIPLKEISPDILKNSTP